MLDNIEAERGRKRLTKEALCEQLGIATKTYNHYINGERAIPHTVLIRMAEAFGCRIDYLLGRTETRT